MSDLLSDLRLRPMLPNLGAVPALNATIAPPMAPVLGAPALPNVIRMPTQVEQDRMALNGLQEAGVASQHISNPLVRGIARAADITGSVFGAAIPGIGRILSQVPGTTQHHEFQVAQAQQRLAADQSDELATAKIGGEQADAKLAQAKVESITHPTADLSDSYRTVSTSKGVLQFNPATGEYDKNLGDVPEKAAAPHYISQEDGSVVAIAPDEHGTPKAQVVYQGAAHVKPVVTQLEVNGQKHTVLVDEHTGNQIKDLGRTGETTPHVSVSTGTYTLAEGADGKPVMFNSKTGEIRDVPGGLNKPGTAAKNHTLGAKVYGTALDSGERFNVMAENYEKAMQGDQQAQLSLLANHLGMTMGLQKGARLNKDVIEEAKKSVPMLQGMKARFSSDGVLNGIALSPQQMRQMVELGQGRFREDITKANNEASYQGVTDGGPKRSPNASTVRYYTHLAGGDPAKAKALAAQDGWSIQ